MAPFPHTAYERSVNYMRAMATDCVGCSSREAAGLDGSALCV